MQFSSGKFEWIRYEASQEAPPKQYLTLDSSNIEQKESLRDLGAIPDSDLSFTLQISRAIQRASQMIGWALRTFKGRSRLLLITVLKSLVQPHLDYCSQLWCPDFQGQINKIEQVQACLSSATGKSWPF